MPPALAYENYESGPASHPVLEKLVNETLSDLNVAVIDVNNSVQDPREVREAVIEKFFPLRNNEHNCRYTSFEYEGDEYVVVHQCTDQLCSEDENSPKAHSHEYLWRRIEDSLPSAKRLSYGGCIIGKYNVRIKSFTRKGKDGSADTVRNGRIYAHKMCGKLGWDPMGSEHRIEGSRTVKRNGQTWGKVA